MAEEEETTTEQTTAEGPDLSFLPETFKKDDGWDTEGFKAHYDELASFKSQADEAAAAIPESPEGYDFALPEDHQLPEGFDPTQFKVPVMDENGKPKIGADGQPEMKDFDPADMIDKDDPDLPLLQQALHEYGVKPGLMGKLTSILANRELRSVVAMNQQAQEQKTALGPNAQSRIDTVGRTIRGILPDAQATAVLDTITSADALRGLEQILKKSSVPVPSAAPGQSHADMSIDDRILLGLQQRNKRA